MTRRNDEHDEESGDWEPTLAQGARPTRSEQARAAAALDDLSKRLGALSAEDLDRVDLAEPLRDAIDVYKRLKPRSRARQIRLISQFLRVDDSDAIRGRVDALRGAHGASMQQERLTERWRDRIVDEGDAALTALVDEYPEADRHRLRQLMRTARGDSEARSTKRARRELLRAIRALRS